MDARWNALGFAPADILLPQGVAPETWSVIACDQYTSQSEYWARVEARVGDAPSTLRMILPEHKLGQENTAQEISAIHATMEDYLARDLFRVLPHSLVYVERWLDGGKLRRGVIGAVDLECYDYRPDANSLIRATEQTVLSRIPPRAQVRRGAALEFPHVMMLIDDPEEGVIEPLTTQTDGMEALYDFDLMERGGHISGWRLDEAQMDAFASALRALLGDDTLLFAVGDGNHSLASAKAVYEEKKGTPEGEACRYALVEIGNLHDASLQFEPIHRVCFHVDPTALRAAFFAAYPNAFVGRGAGQEIVFVTGQGEEVVTVPDAPHPLPVGTLQRFLDDYLTKNGGEIDYIHGEDVLRSLSAQPEAIGFILPAMEKSQLFPAIRQGGTLPRKTFSMGEAWDKRFYLEGRRIR